MSPLEWAWRRTALAAVTKHRQGARRRRLREVLAAPLLMTVPMLLMPTPEPELAPRYCPTPCPPAGLLQLWEPFECCEWEDGTVNIRGYVDLCTIHVDKCMYLFEESEQRGGAASFGSGRGVGGAPRPGASAIAREGVSTSHHKRYPHGLLHVRCWRTRITDKRRGFTTKRLHAKLAGQPIRRRLRKAFATSDPPISKKIL